MPVWAWPIANPIGFALWWCFLMWAIAHVFGWSSLARHYRAADRFTGKLRHFRSGKIGWSNYSGCLTVGANSEGLYLAVIFLFRVGHPPLFIPWTDIVAAHGKVLWVFGEWMEFRAKKSGSKILLRGSVGRELAADANKAWAIDEPA